MSTGAQGKSVCRVLMMLAVAAVIAACGNDSDRYFGNGGGEMENASPEQQRNELMGCPDIERITRKYREMMSAIETRFSKELGLTGWKDNGETLASGCGGYPDIPLKDKESRQLKGRLSSGNIPDEQWNRARDIAQDVVDDYGFGRLEPLIDQPGDHSVEATDSFGGRISVGTKVQTVISAGTGCHPTVDAGSSRQP